MKVRIADLSESNTPTTIQTRFPVVDKAALGGWFQDKEVGFDVSDNVVNVVTSLTNFYFPLRRSRIAFTVISARQLTAFLPISIVFSGGFMSTPLIWKSPFA